MAACVLTTYDELSNNYKQNLNTVFWGTAIGGFIGSFFDTEMSNLTSYIGAVIGGTIGMVKSKREQWHEIHESKNLAVGLLKIKTQYENSRKLLLENTLNKLLTPNE